MIHNSVPTTIENFVWFHHSDEKDRLVYFDENGKQWEKDIPSDQLQEALKHFDGRKRAIRRSSGGLVLCEPCQLILFDSEDGKNPRLGIRVKFMDLERSENGVVKSPIPLIHTKIVRPSDLKPSFELNNDSQNKLIVEFGRGIIPIYLTGQSLSLEGQKLGHFVVENELLACIHATQLREIQTYSAQIEVIRMAESSAERNIDYAVAKDNADWQLNLGESPLPECLATGLPVSIPPHTSAEMVQHLIRLSATQEGRKLLQPLIFEIQTGKEELLLPFGIFEH